MKCIGKVRCVSIGVSTENHVSAEKPVSTKIAETIVVVHVCCNFV